MASALYLENFLENIENLPNELQRNFALMRSLDQRAQDLLKEVEVNSTEYKAKVKGLTKVQRTERLKKIQETFQKAREYSDDKVQIAMQMYEMVDKHIRRLDSDLSRFEQELKMKEPGMRRTSLSSIAEIPAPLPSKNRKRSTTAEGSGSVRKKKLASTSDEPGPSVGSPAPHSSQSTSGGPADVLDMPVDPNEPTYCLCHQVSFGEMIGCDNPDCPIEWFHFQCVDLTSKPKGKWYCPKCSQERDKSKKKF